MTASRRETGHRAEGGATSVLFTLLMALVFIAMVAFVIDLAFMRLDRRETQTVADVSSIAGVMALWGDPYGPASPQVACETAWDYALINAPGAPTSEPAPCGGFPTSTTSCDTGSPYVASGTAGEYSVTIQWPVGDDDPAMKGRLDPTVDGTPCERLAVMVDHDRRFLFAPAGIDESTTGATVGAPAVARSTFGDSIGQVVALVVLEETSCDALVARGNGQIWVRDPVTYPGMITVDSDGSTGCSGADPYVIDVRGSNAEIKAGVDGSGNITNGRIFSYALAVGNETNAYDIRDTGGVRRTCDAWEIGDRLGPTPCGGDRITRAPIDDRYLEEIDDLRHPGGPIGASGRPSSGTWTAWNADAGHPCTVESDIGPLTGDWWIDCPTGLTIQPGRTVTFGASNVVADGAVIVKGALHVNDANSGNDTFIYVRSGHLEKASDATIELGNPANQSGVFVYLHDGVVRLEGGKSEGGLTWVAPFDCVPFRSPCTTVPDEDMEDLALWSESASTHRLAGQAELILEGVFFTPNALPFEFAGGNQTTRSFLQTDAQFITRRLDVSGNGTFIMEPDPERSVKVKVRGVSLIR